MATENPVSNKKVLVIDDMPGMRSQLQMSLSMVGFEKLHISSSAKEALTRISDNDYDIFLCDYFMGDSTNGQQFLEYLRSRNIIRRNAIFIIITAESSYERVVAAAECAPNDYILKPFTADQLLRRLDRLLVSQAVFSVIDQACDEQNWHLVIAECNKLLEKKDKFYIDACRVKSSALMEVNRTLDAIAVYEEVLQLRDLPWAQLGLAKAFARQGKLDESLEILRKLIEAFPQYTAAYDFMSLILLQSNQEKEALAILDQASEISPGNMNRTREMTALAMTNNQHALAEALIKDALKKHKYSPVREANDYGMLARALTAQGKEKEALEILKDMASVFKDPISKLIFATNASIAYRKLGNDEAADIELEKALATENIESLPAHTAATLADAYFAAGREEEANTMLKQVLQNNPEDIRLQAKVKMVFAVSGKDTNEAAEIIEQSAREIVRINNEGVRKAQSGDYPGAIKLLVDAAERLPNNIQIISNAALILAASLQKTGHNPENMRRCLDYRQLLNDKDPEHPKLSQIDTMLKKAQGQ